MRLIREITIYFELCATVYPDDFKTVQGLTDSAFSPAELDRACAEIAYFRQHGVLPDWVTVLQEVEEVDGAYIFVYRGVLH